MVGLDVIILSNIYLAELHMVTVGDDKPRTEF